MAQTGAVTILAVDTKSGVSAKNGKPWTIFNVKASDGNTYSTFDAPIAQAAGQSNGTPVVLEFDERINGDYTNYDLKGVSLANGNGATATANPAPVAQVAPNQAVVGGADPGVASTYAQDKDARITRLSAASTAFQNFSVDNWTENDVLRLAEKIEKFANGEWSEPQAAPAPQPVVAGTPPLPWENDAA